MTVHESRFRKHLILLRHASAQPGADDRARPLTPAGEREAQEAGRALAALASRGLGPTCALVSSARRASDTWRLAAAALAAPPAAELDPRLYLASAALLLRRLRETPDEHACVLLVGHNPGLSELAHDLVGRREAAARGGLAPGLAPGAGVVLRLAVPGWEDLAPGRAEPAGPLLAAR